MCYKEVVVTWLIVQVSLRHFSIVRVHLTLPVSALVHSGTPEFGDFGTGTSFLFSTHTNFTAKTGHRGMINVRGNGVYVTNLGGSAKLM